MEYWNIGDKAKKIIMPVDLAAKPRSGGGWSTYDFVVCDGLGGHYSIIDDLAKGQKAPSPLTREGCIPLLLISSRQGRGNGTFCDSIIIQICKRSELRVLSVGLSVIRNFLCLSRNQNPEIP